MCNNACSLFTNNKKKAINNSKFLVTQRLTKNQSAEQQKQKFDS